MILYSKKGKECNCDDSQVAQMLKAGYSKKKPSKKKIVEDKKDSVAKDTDKTGDKK